MPTNFEPLGNRVLVLPDPTAEKSEGGLYIPDMAKHRPSQGTVVSVGPGNWHAESQTYTPLNLKPGDKVLYGKYAGTDIQVDDTEYVITTEEDIMGIIRKVPVEDADAELSVA